MLPRTSFRGHVCRLVGWLNTQTLEMYELHIHSINSFIHPSIHSFIIFLSIIPVNHSCQNHHFLHHHRHHIHHLHLSLNHHHNLESHLRLALHVAAKFAFFALETLHSVILLHCTMIQYIYIYICYLSNMCLCKVRPANRSTPGKGHSVRV